MHALLQKVCDCVYFVHTKSACSITKIVCTSTEGAYPITKSQSAYIIIKSVCIFTKILRTSTKGAYPITKSAWFIIKSVCTIRKTACTFT